MTLVEAGPELFPMFKPKLREYAAKALADRTVGGQDRQRWSRRCRRPGSR